MAALDLDHLSHGRFVLGLGTGPKHWTKGYYGMPYDKPVSRLREVVQILRHVEDGARTGTMKPWQGDCYQLEFHGYEPTAPPYRVRLPVWIAALRPRMANWREKLPTG
jgi:alkanesulfonate monooxygenase SsuD/methylene tetrahydromethanopterin reductase-like flavin-dependent oxidoreductase (luciferase family)